MDNFTGLFEDGELETLDLGGGSFGPPQGSNPVVSVAEIDLASYTQPYADLGSAESAGPNSTPDPGPSAQKMTVGVHPQTNQSSLANYSSPAQTFQYGSATPSQQPATQFAGGQYRASYPAQEIYNQGPSVQASPGLATWSASDHYSQVGGNFQQQAPPPSSFAQQGMNSYTNQNISSGPVNTLPAQTYQGLPPQSNRSQSYTSTSSQGIPYQGATRPAYPNFDPQSPIGAGSAVPNFNSGAQQAAPAQPQQQYSLIQAPRQSFHMGQYSSPSQVPLGQQQPPPPQQQAPQPPVPGGPQMVCGSRPQGDVPQYSNPPVANGTPYRAPFPQVSPHAQPSPRPQLSPMPRSMSPHARPNSSLAMTSPVSSPVTLSASGSSPAPHCGGGGTTNLQQLETLVNPVVAAGRNTPTNTPCSTPTPLQSPVLYGNSGGPSPMGQRAPMSPGLGRGSRTPMTHQSYIQTNYNPSVVNVQPRAPVPSSLPHGPIPNDDPSLSTDSIPSLSDSSLNLNGCAVGATNGPVTSSIVLENIPVSLENGQVSNSGITETSCGPGITNVVSIVNGSLSLSENMPPVQCNVPPSNISPGGTPQTSLVCPSSIGTQLSSVGNVPHQAVQSMGATRVTLENGLPTSATIKVMVPQMPTAVVPSQGNTVVRFSTTPQGARVSYPPQSYIMIAPPRVCGPQSGPIGPATSPRQVSAPTTGRMPHTSSILKSNKLSTLNSRIQLDQNSPISHESPGSQRLSVPETVGEEAPLNEGRLPETSLQHGGPVGSQLLPQQPGPHGSANLDLNLTPAGSGANLPNGPITALPVTTEAMDPTLTSQMQNSSQLQGSTLMHTATVLTLQPISTGPTPGVPPNQATPPQHTIAAAGPVSGGVRAQPPIARAVQPAGGHGPPPIQPQLNLSIEIQQCQQQLQQVYKMPQNVQTQQKIKELQQRLTHLQQQQQQQQQHFLQNQAFYSSQTTPTTADSPEKKPAKKKNSKPRTPKEPKPPKVPKPKKEAKPREPRVRKEPKIKVPKEPKPPKEQKPKKDKPPPKRSRKKPIAPSLPTTCSDGQSLPTDLGALPTVLPDPNVAEGTPTDIAKNTPPAQGQVTPKSKSEKKARPKSSSKKKSNSKINASVKNKRRRRGSESDYSETEGITLHKVDSNEDDESKRRSGRNQGLRKKYVDELELNLSEEEEVKNSENPNEEDSENPGVKPNFVFLDTNVEDTMAVQVIMTVRMAEREVPVAPEDDLEPEEDKAGSGKSKSASKKVEVEEFFVKYKAFSYLHCEWKTEEELLKGDKRIQGKIKRFKQKRAASQNIMDFLEEEPFNPDYVEMDRILDVHDIEEAETGRKLRHYLVKWKALPYEDATWEVEDDCDTDKIELFEQYRNLPPKGELKVKKRPKAEEWKQIDMSSIYKNNNQLREYQLEGLNWLNFSYYNGHNCILADEMGLGKTIQSLAFVHACYTYGIRGPYLIIAPLSTIPNWQREFESWTDLNVIVYHGSQASRNMILEYEMYYKGEGGEKIPNVYKFHVLITTFEVIISDSVELKEINWRCCIIDEAHRLKNRNCKLLEGLRIMHMEHRVLLSGTPLQNNVNELFSLLNFLEPSQFSCQETFLQEFGKLESEEQVKKLQALLKPMMLRRMKEDVEKSLAPKEETIIEVELTNIQKKYYRAILERNFDFLIKGATYTNVPSLMNTVMELRKCCLHPYLLNGAEDGIQQDYKESHLHASDVYHNALIQSSGKMVLVDKLLPRLKDNGHRVLIFSQMVKLLDIIEDYLIYRKYPYERLDGRIRGNLRQAAIDRFCKPDSDRFVFLLCTKAGGLGINLTAADTVIIYDSDWNPQNDLQAQARCHRIGQQKRVKIYRLLCRNTYEREMFDKASLKLGLDKAVLQSMNTEVKAAAGNSLGLSKKDIEDLLKKGAYGALMEEDNQGDKFCEEDIDQIMSRRTTVITLESEKGSTFSKASFSASSNRSDIDLDDPDFWKKWAKRADIDLEAGEKHLIVEEPRRRSQIRRYGHDDSVMDCSDLETSASDSGGEHEGGEDTGNETRSRTRRGRGRGRNRGQKNSRNTRSSRWNTEEEPGDMDEVKYGLWHRSECFKVEKGLLTFGWGRWEEIMKLGEFRSAWKMSDIQECARMILLFCIRYYRGDDKIKGFIFDLIAPTSDGKTRMHHNHIGLSAPVPRGRKGKKKLREAKLIASHMEGSDWAKEEKFDTDNYLDQGYSRHLTRHANKVLLRVRLLFYVKQEIIGDLSLQIEENCRANDLPIHPPPTELPPKPWWDNEADRNILVGVYKHGYDRYNVVRNDPLLCFLARCGPPDKAALVAEMSNNVNEDEMEKDEKEEEKEEKEDSDSNQTTPSSPAVSSVTNKSEDDPGCAKEREKKESKYLPFPSSSDINGRLRRLVTSYQRNNKKMEMRKEANVRGFDHYLADKLMRRERMAEYIRERELRKADYNQRRWSNREQAEFYRTISTFGVEYIRKEKRYDWIKFRMLSRLEKRLDENLTEYFRAFMAMCKRQCGIRLSDQENAKIVDVGVDRLPEERARRVLERVDLLNRLRNDILPHPDLPQALDMALPSKDLPDWWIPGKHDLDLIRGVARHGLGRTDYYILYDPDLCFREILRRHTAGEPLITQEEKVELDRKFYNGSMDEKEETEQEERPQYAEENPSAEANMAEEEDAPAEDQSQIGETPDESKEVAGDESIVKEEDGEQEAELKPEIKEGNSEEKVDIQTDLDVPKEEEPEKIENECVEREIKEESEKNTNPYIDTKCEQSEGEIPKKEEKNDAQKLLQVVKEELKDTKDAIPAPPLLSLQQMDEAMSKMGSGLTIDSLAANEPTVAQLLAQSAANPIKWPKDRVLQTRLEHMMFAVEQKKWPVPIDFQSSDHDHLSSSKCDTPPSAPSTPTGHHSNQDLLMMEAVEKRKRRHLEEVERAHLQAMLHPNLHHNMALSKVPHTTAAAAAAAAAALGFNPNSFSVSSLRSLMEANDPDKKAQSLVADSHTHALRQLQALQGSLDLTIKPVSSQSLEMGIAGYLNRRGPGRPRLDEPMMKNIGIGSEKRRTCDSPQDKKRRKLDDIVLGLSSSKGRSPDNLDAVVKEANNPLALLKHSSVTLLSSKEKAQVTPAVTAPKLSSSISITPTNLGNKFPGDARADPHSPVKGFNPFDKEGGTKPGLVKSSDLPPGISLPPGIELYRPTDSAKVDKWLEQHQDLLNDPKPSIREPKRRKIDFSSLDWSQFSGDEPVPVVNSTTGQKLSASDSPKLKHLAQWLMEHPNYDVDPHWSELKKESGLPPISDLQRRLLAGDKKGVSGRAHSISSPLPSPSLSSNSPTSSSTGKNMLDPRHVLQGLDLKNPMALAALTSLDPKLLANLDPKILFAGIDPKLLGLDPKHPAFDPKLLAAMGIDPKIFGMDPTVAKHPEQKPDKKPSPAPSPKASEPKPSTSHAIDPKVFAGLDPKAMGLDPKLLSGLDPKVLAGIDPKSLNLDPKLLGLLDPKVLSNLGGVMDPKFFPAMGGLDPVMMMAGFGGLPGMAGLGLANPLLAGLPGFNLAGMPNLGGSSKSKENQRNAAAAAAAAVAASQSNLFSGIFGGAGGAGLMYPPLGLGTLGNYSLPQSSGILNGFSPTVTAVAGTSKVQTSSAGSATRRQQRQQEAADREAASRKERLKEGAKMGGLSKEERHLLKQMKAERLARVDPRTTVQSHEALLASHLNQLSALGQIDLSVRPLSSSSPGTGGNVGGSTSTDAGGADGVSPKTEKKKGEEKTEPEDPEETDKIEHKS